MSSISYCIGVYKDPNVFQLINFLKKHITSDDEICVIADNSKSDNLDIIEKLKKIEDIKLSYFSFDTTDAKKINFSDLKNYKISQCSKEYVFDLDADELLTEKLVKNIRSILALRSDVYMIPRANKVIDLTEEYAKLFNYTPDERGFISFPDYQARLFKNNGQIKWTGVIHETLGGHQKQTILKPDPEIAIIHNKHLTKEIEHYNMYYKFFDKNKLK
jgi:hypothetical protein